MCETSASRGQILTKQQLEELNNESLRVQNGISLLKFCWSREKIKQKFDERELRVRFQTAFYKYSICFLLVVFGNEENCLRHLVSLYQGCRGKMENAEE